MLNLEYENKENSFKRYNNGKGYLITVQIVNERTEYRVFKDYDIENIDYLPQINYNNYYDVLRDTQFTVYRVTHIPCSITDIDELISEHEKFIDGLKIAKESIQEFKEYFNI